MGNLITLAIKTQVRVLGIGNLDPNYHFSNRSSQQRTKVCSTCHNIQRNVDNSNVTCQLCGGSLQVLQRSSSSDDYDPWTVINTETQMDQKDSRKKRKQKDLEPWPKFHAIEMSAMSDAMVQLTTILKMQHVEKKGPYCLHEAITRAENTMTCSVCLDKFEKPITLPCGHSMCISHAEEIAKESCPICRKSFASIHETHSFGTNSLLIKQVHSISALVEQASVSFNRNTEE